MLLSDLHLEAGCLHDTDPRFEDAFIDLLGGGPASESSLASIMPQIDVSGGETVIEAQALTKNLVISPQPITSAFR